ncbi:helix-turn-helix transcriptional regulator [Alloalcanivorax gelatiniphagus]|uniref:Helix-turn-helix transcriptional regulator n=1 Tax=Alloalcanivorax gelatiniphagus TaxID=1194167 RepID=A0ABY2XKS9_9GAMM|nr:helix-turn-helix transcriptional regulator [Alloalcanivorax gelatiniphagus]TMW12289.1 helix-turn-helix transcriptional regulator [Alloalcanivorax gelatiniphagus]|tara:strand:+ start:4921 stop:5688 length:768 start_codon:yes stop_codon:yes gene_type:complete
MSYQNRLYVWDDRFLYLTESIVSGLTQRHTVTLLVSLGEPGFRLGDERGGVAEYPAALVGNQTARSLDASRAPLLSMNFDPQSYEYHCLAAMLGRQPVRPVIVTPGRIDAATLRGARDGSLDPAGLFRLTTALPQALSGYRPIRMPMDMRVIHIAQKIKKELPLTSTLEELGAEVGLSAHRLRHLFSDKMGISIKSYTLWARMRRAVELIARHEPLSMVAHDVGFSDAAHLTRTLKQFFGLTPSFLARGMEVSML